jgi:eukaryotic-like serine/threonine-protein kinase
MEEKPEKKGYPSWALFVVGILIGLALIAVLIILFTDSTKTVTVPNIIGLTEAQATQVLNDVGLKLETQSTYAQSELQKAGIIVSQDPAQGVDLEKDSTVTGTVTVELRMPDVVGMNQSLAVSTIKGAGITIVDVTTSPVLDATKIGIVLLQSPLAGALVSPETNVSLEVGGETQNVVVPSVVGLDQASAKAQLDTVGLDVKVTQQTNSAVKPGLVISQSPAAGQPVQKGSTVNIVVSAAPTPG